MIKGDTERKLFRGRDKIRKTLVLHNNSTVMLTGIVADDCRIALASVYAGARIIEINHPSVSLSIGFDGVKSMREAEDIRHRLPIEEVIRKVRALRRVVGDEVYLSVAVPGLFSETVPTPLTPDDFQQIARSGADGLHVHKSNLEDLRDIVAIAHETGLLVDSYISDSDDKDSLGIPADSDKEIAVCAKTMEKIGVDFVGLMMGQSFKGKESNNFPEISLRRLRTLVLSSSVPVLAEGGITAQNIASIRKTGAHISVIGTYLDDTAKQNMIETVTDLIINQKESEQ